MISNRPTFQEAMTLDDFQTRYADIREVNSIPEQADLPTQRYYAFLSRFGNRTIANSSADMFKIKFKARLSQYLPQWFGRWYQNQKLRQTATGDAADSLSIVGTAISNHATNPSAYPSTDTFDKLPYIDSQNQSQQKTGSLDTAMKIKAAIVDNDFDELLDRFEPLFSRFVKAADYIYVTED